jgi:hypothetical protein
MTCNELAWCRSYVWREEVLVLVVHSGLMQIGDVQFGDTWVLRLMLLVLLVVRHVVLELVLHLRELVIQISLLESSPCHSALVHATSIIAVASVETLSRHVKASSILVRCLLRTRTHTAH